VLLVAVRFFPISNSVKIPSTVLECVALYCPLSPIRCVVRCEELDPRTSEIACVTLFFLRASSVREVFVTSEPTVIVSFMLQPG